MSASIQMRKALKRRDMRQLKKFLKLEAPAPTKMVNGNALVNEVIKFIANNP